MSSDTSAPALILFAHGARDARWAEPMTRVRNLLLEARPGTQVLCAYLEIMQPDLSTALTQLAALACRDVVIVPLFLGQGGHVRRDLPALVVAMQQRFPELRLRVAPAAGEDEQVLRALAQYCLDQIGAA